ncbi:MAG: MarR family transcriptional regulator [Pseudomonadota bacterium]
MKKTRGFDTWFEVGRANLMCHRVLNTLLADLGLSLAQHEVLATINGLDEPTQKTLSERLLVVKSNVSALLAKLEARGLVARRTDSSDSRNKRLRLTDAGKALLSESMERQNRVVSAMASGLSDDELERLSSIMQRASSALAALEQQPR